MTIPTEKLRKCRLNASGLCLSSRICRIRFSDSPLRPLISPSCLILLILPFLTPFFSVVKRTFTPVRVPAGADGNETKRASTAHRGGCTRVSRTILFPLYSICALVPSGVFLIYERTRRERNVILAALVNAVCPSHWRSH
ncbi:hypothetical protein DFH07DRAFT_845561 [Mycena maculata]|uniref:Transmembrane protein n=1 Tax=Mycena maculata TaxID=230809 RepID=A0AAD7I2H4_9AGAR|nr:hypothetical protein DFH07DRAFT_845561 [Mycena maculata]